MARGNEEETVIQTKAKAEIGFWTSREDSWMFFFIQIPSFVSVNQDSYWRNKLEMGGSFPIFFFTIFAYLIPGDTTIIQRRMMQNLSKRGAMIL